VPLAYLRSWVTFASTLHANKCLISVLLATKGLTGVLNQAPESSIAELGAVPSDVADSLHERRSLTLPACL
jgi:hypothetical protein